METQESTKNATEVARSLRETRLIMGMPVTIELVDEPQRRSDALEETFSYFKGVDEQFSPYKDSSEVSRFNRSEVLAATLSEEMREVFALAEETRRATNGYFDIRRSDGSIDPSGIVKGWAIQNAARSLAARGFEHFYVEAGGDIQTHGTNAAGLLWTIGIRNPFNANEIVKVLHPYGNGVATSGTSMRGQHIYNPHARHEPLTEVVSLTVVGPNILESDRFATAAFAMGASGIEFIEALPGFEGYEIRADGRARFTSGFTRYVAF